MYIWDVKLIYKQKSKSKMKRFSKEDFPHISPVVELLLQIQQARYDKKNSGDGLSLQEDAEFLGISNFLDAESKNQKADVPELQNVVDKWYEFKDDPKLDDCYVVEEFDEFICSLMEKFKLT